MNTVTGIEKHHGSSVYLHMYDLEANTPDGPFTYEMVSRNRLTTTDDMGKKTNAVCIVPIFSDGSFLATEEFRFPLNARCLEFPAGLIDPGETPTEAAIRELKEETGMDTKHVLFVIPGGFSSAGMTDEKVAIVGLLVNGEYCDTTGKEDIRVFRATAAQLWKRITEGAVCSSRMQCFLLGYMFQKFGIMDYRFHLDNPMIQEKERLCLNKTYGEPTFVYQIFTQTDSYDGQPYDIITAVTFRMEMLPLIGKKYFITAEEAKEALKRRECRHSTG